MVQYRVIDLRSGGEAEQVIDARSPILAATLVLGENVIRGNRNLGAPVCRVYWQEDSGPTNMVRLYRGRLGLAQGWSLGTALSFAHS